MNKVSANILSLVAMLFLSAAATAATAQSGTQHSTKAPASADSPTIDIGVSGFEAMNSNTTGKGVLQTPSNAAGGMLEIRRIQSPLIGYEFTYSMHPANETDAPASSTNCGLYCSTPALSTPTKANAISFDWVFSRRYKSLRPFVIGGIGLMFEAPAYSVAVGQAATLTNTYFTNNVNRVTWNYGGGVDYQLSTHWGVRAQIRGMTYRAPNLSPMYPALGQNTNTFMPMGGAFYSF